jgi:hypothetical protein
VRGRKMENGRNKPETQFSREKQGKIALKES